MKNGESEAVEHIFGPGGRIASFSGKVVLAKNMYDMHRRLAQVYGAGSLAGIAKKIYHYSSSLLFHPNPNFLFLVFLGILLFIYAIGLLSPLIGLSAYIDRLPKDGKIWTLMKGKLYDFKIAGKIHYIHSTNLVTGIMFLGLGSFFVLNSQFNLIGFIPNEITQWVFGLEDIIVERFKIM